MLRDLIRALISYLRTPPVIRSAQAKSDLREEIEFHLTSSVQDQMADGSNPQTSQQLALQRFGDVTAVVRDCCDVSISREVFWHRMHKGTTFALIIAVGFLVYRSRTSPEITAPSPDRLAMTAAGYSLAATSGNIKGSVVAENGQPVKAAHVLAVVKTWPPNGYRQQSYMATSQSDGTFVFEHVYPPGQKYEVQIAAIAEGRLLQSEYISMTTGILPPVQFELNASTPLALRFESDNGQPIEGVSVFPFQRVDRGGNLHMVYFDSADPIVRESSASGKVAMPHFLSGEQATVFVRFPDGEWQTRELVVPAGNNVVVLKPASEERFESG
jgi:hypothetical protein